MDAITLAETQINEWINKRKPTLSPERGKQMYREFRDSQKLLPDNGRLTLMELIFLGVWHNVCNSQ